jgi:UDP-glucose-4-epimerase GalE
VGESVENPALYYRNNVINAINLLESMVECDIPNIVFSSTCAVYGPPQHTPITESHPTHPVNPYGESKLFIEKTLASFASAYDLRPMSLRYFNAAGADVDGELGENHEPETHLIPLAIDSARLPERQLTIFGDDYQTKDGSAVRDYIHVTDLADAHVRALDHLTNGGAPHTLNLGTGQGYSVLEVIKAVENSTGARVNHRFGPRRDGDVSALIADARKSLQVLGWTPKYSSLEEIVRSAAAWRIKGSGAAADRTEVIEQVASSAVFAAS